MELKIRQGVNYQPGYWVFSTASWQGIPLGTTTKDISKNLDEALKSLTSKQSPGYVIVKNEGRVDNNIVWKVVVEG